jgi:hypothetical protein
MLMILGWIPFYQRRKIITGFVLDRADPKKIEGVGAALSKKKEKKVGVVRSVNGNRLWLVKFPIRTPRTLLPVSPSFSHKLHIFLPLQHRRRSLPGLRPIQPGIGSSRSASEQASSSLDKESKNRPSHRRGGWGGCSWWALRRRGQSTPASTATPPSPTHTKSFPGSPLISIAIFILFIYLFVVLIIWLQTLVSCCYFQLFRCKHGKAYLFDKV